jgi:hypothetical protein
MTPEEPAMAVCKDIKHFSRTHERIADFFSLLSVALLFGTVWATLQYHRPVLDWLRHDTLQNSAILIGVLVVDVLLILAFLAVGSSRFGEENEKCFGTFRGRRHHTGASAGIFSAWIRHMENVGKKHR